jgi:Uma2 family endonuclease
MATVTKQWTLEEVHSLPDDGNKYELVRGELFVTPPPIDPHETIGARLARLLDPYVEKEKLGPAARPHLSPSRLLACSEKTHRRRTLDGMTP